MASREGDWDFHLRSLSANARDSSAAGDTAFHPYILQSEICNEGGSEDLLARAYPSINKLFQRAILVLPQLQTSNGLHLLIMIKATAMGGSPHRFILNNLKPSAWKLDMAL